MKEKFTLFSIKIWYEIVWTGVLVTFHFYFKRWQVSGYNNVPKSGPTIYAANHQNAFLDALSIIMSNKRHPIFLTRADIFKSKMARFWLRSMNMIPIYRMRDGKDSIAKNDAVINQCIDFLTVGKQPIAIFPEGNHSMRRSLRPLKKGLGRIAFQAMEANDFNFDLKIIPVGINYSRPSKFRGDLLVNFGEPISVMDYVEEYKKDSNAALISLRQEVEKGIKPLMLDIHDNEHYKEVEQVWAYEKVKRPNMFEELKEDQRKVEEYIKEANDGTLSERLSTPRKIEKHPLKMILGFPLFLYGVLNNLPTHFVLRNVISKVRDIHFYGSIKIATAMFVVPILYLLQGFGVYALTSSWLIAFFYVVTLPFIGAFSYDFKDKYIEGGPDIELVADYFN